MRDTLFDIKALIESNKILRGKLKEAQKRIYELEGRIPPCNEVQRNKPRFHERDSKRSKIS